MVVASTMGGRRVEEGQRVAAHQVEHLPGQGRGAERPRGDDARAVGYGGHLTTLLLDEGTRGDFVLDRPREHLAVDRERTAGGNRGTLGAGEQDRPHAPQLLLEQPRRGIDASRLEGIGADEFGEARGAVRRRGYGGAHLAQQDRNTTVGKLASALAPRQTSTHNRHALKRHRDSQLS